MSAFDAGRSAYAPFATGTPHQYTSGFENIPLIQNNPMLGMIAQPLLSGVMGSVGLSPMGFHDQNMYDQMRRMHLSQMQQSFIAQAAASDHGNYMRTARGLAQMTGTPWGADQQMAARSLSNAMVFATPMLAQMMPDVVDQFGGMRGSAAVMATQMFEGGRYRLDPVTGMAGLSSETMVNEADTVFRSLYEQGDLGRMRGVSAGQLGGLYREMTMRGMIGSSLTPRERMRATMSEMYRNQPGEYHNLGESAGISLPSNPAELSSNDIDQLMSAPEAQQQVRSFDARKVGQQLERYVGAVSAVRDIFGDMGRPNAPMAELIAALDQLSNGSMAQINPGQLQGMVRMTQNLANITGVTIDNAYALQQHAASMGANMGLEPVFGVNAMQGGLSYGGAYRMSGQGAHVAWGRASADQVTQMDTNLRLSGAASVAANRAGAFLRMTDIAAPTAGSDMALYQSALQQAHLTGQTTWTDASGNRRSINMGVGDISKMMESAGMDPAQYTRLLGQEFDNREMVQRYSLGQSVARGTQFESDVRPRLGSYAAAEMSREFQRQGMSSRDALKLAQSISGSVVDNFRTMSGEDMTDDEKRNKSTVSTLRGQLSQTEQGRAMLASMSGTDLSLLANSVYGHLNDSIASDQQLQGFGNLQVVHQMYNPQNMQEAANIRQQSAFRGVMQDAMSPLRRSSGLRSVMDALQNGSDVGVSDLVGRYFGGTSNADIREAISAPLGQLNQKRMEVETLQTEAMQIRMQMSSMDPGSPEHQRLSGELQRKQEAISNGQAFIRTTAGEISTTMGEKGVYMSEELTDSQINNAVGTGLQATELIDRIRSGEADPNRATLRAVSDAVRSAGSSAADIAYGVLGDDNTMLHAGSVGVKAARGVLEANQEIRELALEYTGGDVAKLLRGGSDIDSVASSRARELTRQRQQNLGVIQNQLGERRDNMPEGDSRTSALEGLKKEAGHFRHHINPGENNKELVSRLNASFGLNLNEDQRKELGGLLSSRVSMNMATSLLEGQSTLDTIASNMGGEIAGYETSNERIDALYTAYRAASGDEEALAKFQGDNKLDDAQMGDMKRYFDLMENTGFIRAGEGLTGEGMKHRRGLTGANLLQHARETFGGSLPGGQAQGGEMNINWPEQLRIVLTSGKLKIEGDTATIEEAEGGIEDE